MYASYVCTFIAMEHVFSQREREKDTMWYNFPQDHFYFQTHTYVITTDVYTCTTWTSRNRRDATIIIFTRAKGTRTHIMHNTFAFSFILPYFLYLCLCSSLGAHYCNPLYIFLPRKQLVCMDNIRLVILYCDV